MTSNIFTEGAAINGKCCVRCLRIKRSALACGIAAILEGEILNGNIGTRVGTKPGGINFNYPRTISTVKVMPIPVDGQGMSCFTVVR